MPRVCVHIIRQPYQKLRRSGIYIQLHPSSMRFAHRSSVLINHPEIIHRSGLESTLGSHGLDLGVDQRNRELSCHLQ